MFSENDLTVNVAANLTILQKATDYIRGNFVRDKRSQTRLELDPTSCFYFAKFISYNTVETPAVPHNNKFTSLEKKQENNGTALTNPKKNYLSFFVCNHKKV
jgi:hypothetical protein